MRRQFSTLGRKLTGDFLPKKEDLINSYMIFDKFHFSQKVGNPTKVGKMASLSKEWQQKNGFALIESSAEMGPALPIVICPEISAAMHK